MESFFGIGIAELIFVLIIAVIVFGPRRLPELAAQIGRYVQQLNYMTSGIRAEWQKYVDEAAAVQEQARSQAEEFTKVIPPTPNQLTSQIKSQIENTINPKPSNTEADKIVQPADQPADDAAKISPPVNFTPSQSIDRTPPSTRVSAPSSEDKSHE